MSKITYNNIIDTIGKQNTAILSMHYQIKELTKEVVELEKFRCLAIANTHHVEAMNLLMSNMMNEHQELFQRYNFLKNRYELLLRNNSKKKM